MSVITKEVFQNHLDCQYKANLALQGDKGELHEYELLQRQLQQQHQAVATTILLNRSKLESAESDVFVERLVEALPLIFDTELQHDSCAYRFDALERKKGDSELGAFFYSPVLFAAGTTIRSHHRFLLAFGGYLLGKIQGVVPPLGYVVLGQDVPVSSVRLPTLQPKVQAILRDLVAVAADQHQPKLRLIRHCTVCQFRNQCRTEAIEKDDLSLLGGISERQITENHEKGIFTVHQLSFTFRARRRPKHLQDQAMPYQPSLQAQAIRTGKTYVVARPVVPTAETNVYVDMEGLEHGQFVYLIGALAVNDEAETFKSFWADERGNESQIFDSFYQWLASLGNVQVFHYGSYESNVFKRLQPPSPRLTGLTRENACNVLSLIYRQLYFPVYSNSLKNIAGFLGATWEGESPDGMQAIVWRTKWEQSGGDPSLKAQLLKYNEEDCRALRIVTEHIANISQADGRSQSETVEVSQLGNQDDYGRWGRREFAVDDFKLLADCAYFDYQRAKVYVRTSPAVKKALKQRRRRRTTQTRPTRTVNVKAYKCSWCKSKDLVADDSRHHTKLQLDLRISKSGVRRWITRYRTPYYYCNQCHAHPIPQSYKNKKRYGHNLIVWTPYQHVVNHLSLGQIQISLKECFGIHLSDSYIHLMRDLAARYYCQTYAAILEKIVTGNLLHADEIKAKLKCESGYVWVFTNMDAVYYTYRPSREGEFLHELLGGFSGVLVSDYYSAYDSLPCAQQKCLVHLMWDINADLLKNPFDDELKNIAIAFGQVLRNIIKTADRFGLKSRYLRKHRKEVNRFLAQLEDSDYSSRAGQGYQERFQKNRSHQGYDCRW